jgi:phosphoglycerate kinase
MFSTIKTIEDIEVQNKTVLVRVDLNLPIVHGKFTDLTRLTKIIPTIQSLTSRGAKVVLISHYGNPKGKFQLDMSLSPVVDKLSEALQGMNVLFGVDALSKSTFNQVNKLKPGDVLLLENIRFHPGEKQNDLEFAKQLAQLGEIYVNDAFSCSHRNHASITLLPKLLPSVAGLLLMYELKNLDKYLTNPKKPIMAIIGGSKVSSKINLLNALLEQVDYLVIGGAMANTFLKALNHNIGKSAYEQDFCEAALSILDKAKSLKCQVMLPSDVITAEDVNQTAYKVRPMRQITNKDMILDIGPKFLAEVILQLSEVETVFWNGPLGAFEHIPFDLGTNAIARAIALFTVSNELISIAGGGDVVSAINSTGLCDTFTYVSTGGGAFLKWLENRTLPGVEALLNNASVH